MVEGAKSCPFCGSDALRVKSSMRWGYFVACNPCAAVGPSASSPESAIQKWNTRVEPKQGEAVVMDGAKKLAHLLEVCGAKYTRTDATEGTLFTVSTGDGQYFVLVRDDDAGIEMWSRYFTPEQAIAATVGEEHEMHICKRCGVAYELNIIDKGYGKPRFCPNCGYRGMYQ